VPRDTFVFAQPHDFGAGCRRAEGEPVAQRACEWDVLAKDSIEQDEACAGCQERAGRSILHIATRPRRKQLKFVSFLRNRIRAAALRACFHSRRLRGSAPAEAGV